MTTLGSEEFMDIDTIVSAGIFPSFDQFKKNPDAYRLSQESLFESMDKSTQVHKDKLVKQIYRWKNNYTAKNLDQLHAIVKNEGYRIDELEMVPKMRNINGTSDNEKEIIVEVWPKAEWRAKGGIVTNEL